MGDKTVLVDKTSADKTSADKGETSQNPTIDKHEGTHLDAKSGKNGCQRSGKCGGGKCGGGKCGACCVGMALVGVPVAIVLSPIIVPTLLVRRAIYGPMKCGGKCKRTEEKEVDTKTDKEAAMDKTDETPKVDKM